MNCAYHPDISAEQTCKTCGRALCAACKHPIRDQAYCADCLTQGAEMAEKLRGGTSFTPNPRKAALFAIIPGLGQVYNGKYSRALKQFAIFILLSWIADIQHGAIHLAAVCFYFFMIFDAYRTAQQIQLRSLSGGEAIGDEFTFLEEKQTPVWGIALILLGVIFLLNNVELIDEQFIRHTWPLGLIAAGGYLLYHHMKKQPTTPSPKISSSFSSPSES